MPIPLLALSLAVAARPLAPSCQARALAVAADGRDGDFNGMSHSGTRLIVRNVARQTCLLPALPSIRFLDKRGAALPVVRAVPPGLHPGPAMVPVRLRPGARATVDLRWVSGEVYARSRCVTSAAVALAVRRGTLRLPLAAHLCGEAGKPVRFDQPALAIAR